MKLPDMLLPHRLACYLGIFCILLVLEASSYLISRWFIVFMIVVIIFAWEACYYMEGKNCNDTRC